MKKQIKKEKDLSMGKQLKVCFITALFIACCCISSVGAAIDVIVYEGNLQKVVQGIARSGQLELVGGDSLKGNVTISIHDVTPLEALRAISQVSNFSFVAEEQRIYVKPNDHEHLGRDIVVLQPQHISAKQLGEMLEAVVKKEHLKVRSESEQVVIYGNIEERLRARELLKAVDQPPQQVRVVAHIIAIQRSAIKELGFSWSWLDLTSSGKDKTQTYGSLQWGKSTNNKPYQFFYKAKLDAMQSDGKAVLIASPTMTTINGEEAQILIGDRLPVVTESSHEGKSVATIRYEQAGIRLTYTPHIEKAGYVDATIRAEVSNPTLVSALKAYRITTREAKTRVRLKDGEVLVIGGLVDTRDMNNHQKVPLLGDIPLLGKLFQHSRQEKQEVELLILVQAHIVTEKNESFR